MPARSTHPPKAFDARPARRVPIAMSLALEVVAELRARERVETQHILEIMFEVHPSRRG